MPITLTGATTQVLVRSSTILRPEEFTMTVKGRRGLVKRATANWFYQDGAWRLDTIAVWGPVIRQDGTESTQNLSVLTVPPGSSAAGHQPVAAPELVATAQTCQPTWQPRVAATDLPRHPRLRTSLPASGTAPSLDPPAAQPTAAVLPHTIECTTVEVTIKGYVTFQVSGVTVEIRDRKASVREAEAYWFWDGRGWSLDFVQLKGAYLLASGKEGRQAMSQSSHPPEQNDYRLVTPPELLTAVRDSPPAWDPAFTGCPGPVTFLD